MNTHEIQRCRQFAPLIETVVNGSGAPKDIEAVEAHIVACADCRAEYNQWKQTVLLTETWRMADVPESRRDWNDLHARLTAPKPQKLRPAFALRLGLGGLVGAAAIAAFCLLLPHSAKEGEKSIVKQDVPITQTPLMEKLALVPGTKTYPPQKQASCGRTFAAASLPAKMKRDKPLLTLVKSQESKLSSPQKKSVSSPSIGGLGRLVAQTKPEAPRRVILNVDGETGTSDTTHEYALGAIPSGHDSHMQLTPASYSSSSEKTAW